MRKTLEVSQHYRYRLSTMLRLGVILLLLFSAPFLCGAQELSNLLEDWFAVENALEKPLLKQAGNEPSETELMSALEKFSISLDRFTGSLIFSQYERIGLLPENSGKEIRQTLSRLIVSVNEGESAAVKQEAEAIAKELARYIQLDTKVSSQGFSRLAWVFGVFVVLTIILFGVVWYLYSALRRSQIQEKNSAEFSRITMLVQEKERAHLSAELHDTVLQDMGRLLQMGEEGSPSINELTLKILTRIREICRELMPPDFSRLSLTDSLKQLCADFEKRAYNEAAKTGTECRAVITEDFSRIVESGRISAQMQLQIFRIVQESLANIEKHSKACEATLTARSNGDKTLLICVTDDGIGISEQSHSAETAVKKSRSVPGLGIRGMYQRAAILGASLSFVPGAGQGLTVRLEVPLAENFLNNKSDCVTEEN